MIPIKSEREILKMRAACKVASEILQRVEEYIQPGQSTKEVDQYAAGLMEERNCDSAFLGYKGYPGHICISINEEVVHGIGGLRRIQYGDLVKIDIGIIKNGWVGDNATTVAVGVVGQNVLNLMKVTEEALYKGIKQARGGNRLHEISAAIETHAHQHGMGVVREFVGHGVGKKLHEEPQVPNYVTGKNSPRLRPGMVLAIEPMINAGGAAIKLQADGWTVVTADGCPSAHFEHTVLITKGEPEILTWRKKTQLKCKAK